MLKLFILNFSIIAVSAVVLFLLKKFFKKDKQIDIIMLVLPILTVLCHYSSLLYHQIKEGTCMGYLTSNPNLVLPIYPCNVVMWCALIYGILQRKNNRFTRFLADYIFFFGVISALVGLFANVDFIRNPSLKDYDILKGVLAHGFMLLNVLALPVFKKIKIDLPVNMVNIAISVVMMLIIGLYCNLLISVVANEDYAYQVNSMFLIHSPFDGAPYLKYGLIALVAIVCYFIILSIAELIAYKKDNRWYKRKFNW